MRCAALSLTLKHLILFLDYRTSIWCHVPNCNNHFDTVFAYENHYNAFHRYLCSQCRKQLPSAHLLDLHLSERHDSFFAAQAERKPMVIGLGITRQIEFDLCFFCGLCFGLCPLPHRRAKNNEDNGGLLRIALLKSHCRGIMSADKSSPFIGLFLDFLCRTWFHIKIISIDAFDF